MDVEEETMSDDVGILQQTQAKSQEPRVLQFRSASKLPRSPVEHWNQRIQSNSTFEVTEVPLLTWIQPLTVERCLVLLIESKKRHFPLAYYPSISPSATYPGLEVFTLFLSIKHLRERERPKNQPSTMSSPNTNKTVLVTGATGLLGRQVAKAFAFHDWTVKGTGFSRADGKSILKVDLQDKKQIEEVLDEVKYVRRA
jgi:hypothetical protein